MEPNTTWPGLIWPVLLDSSSFFFSRGPGPWSESWLISAGRCFVHDDHGEHEHEHGPSIIMHQSINQSWGQATKKEDDNLDMSLSELLCKQASRQASKNRPIKNWPRKPFLQPSPILHLHLHNHHNGMSGSLCCCCCCWFPSVNLVNSTKQQYNSKISYRPRRQGCSAPFWTCLVCANAMQQAYAFMQQSIFGEVFPTNQTNTT